MAIALCTFGKSCSSKKRFSRPFFLTDMDKVFQCHRRSRLAFSLADFFQFTMNCLPQSVFPGRDFLAGAGAHGIKDILAADFLERAGGCVTDLIPLEAGDFDQ